MLHIPQKLLFPKPAGGILYPLYWECIGISKKELDGVNGQRDVCISHLNLLPLQPNL